MVCGAEAKVGGWVVRWRQLMMNVAVDRVEDRDVAEDIVQRAFITALDITRKDPEEIEKVWKPSAWLVRITLNLASDVLKRQARRRRLRRRNGDEIRENLFPDRDGARKEDPRAESVLATAARVLTKRQAEVFRLLWGGMKDEEIARELGMKPETVRWHRAIVIRKLREHMFGERGGVFQPGHEHERAGGWGRGGVRR